MRETAAHEVRVVGWVLDLARPMRAALDEEVHWLFEALDEALALMGEAPPAETEPESGPVAVVWRSPGRTVRLVVLRGRHAEDELATSRGRRLRIGPEPAVVTVLTQSWARDEGEGTNGAPWTLRARGAAPGSLALLFVSSTAESDGPWARSVARSLRYDP